MEFGVSLGGGRCRVRMSRVPLRLGGVGLSLAVEVLAVLGSRGVWQSC